MKDFFKHYAMKGFYGDGGDVAEPITEPLTVTENGSYSAPEGVDGYNPVTVNVPTGGGGSTASVPWNDVTFIDYDGTVLYSYSQEEAQALTELPPLPEQKGLICQGWNWSLEDIKAQNGPVIVGAMYITDDGKTRIYITLHEGRTSPMLGCCPKGTVTVDWGDGTEPDVLTGTSTSAVKWTPNHEYAEPGDYVISLSVDGEMGCEGDSNSSSGSRFLRYDTSSDNRGCAYRNSITKIELGQGVTSIGSYAFMSCQSLRSVTIPNNTKGIGYSAFYFCHSLRSVVIPSDTKTINSYAFDHCHSMTFVSIPSSVTSIKENSFEYCYSMALVTIPGSVTSIGSYLFSECNSLKSVVIPNGISSIEHSMFKNCNSLKSVAIPNGVTKINNYGFSGCLAMASIVFPSGIKNINTSAFNSCYSMRYYDFSACTSVPTLGATNAFQYIPADCQMLIPSALYDEWSTATNWATYASKMVAV